MTSDADAGSASIDQTRDLVRVRPEADAMSRQRLPYFIGISGDTVGATGLSMNLVVIPPGGAAGRDHDALLRRLDHAPAQTVTRRVLILGCASRFCRSRRAAAWCE